jgi:succinate dehydrogenase/fumarate reductase cytochrome b subunit
MTGIRSPVEADAFPLASVSRPALSEAHPASCTMGTWGPFPAVKRNRGVTLTTHPLLVPRSRMNRSYISSLPRCLHGGSGAALFLLYNCSLFPLLPVCSHCGFLRILQRIRMLLYLVFFLVLVIGYFVLVNNLNELNSNDKFISQKPTYKGFQSQ